MEGNMVQRTINFKDDCCNAQSFFNAPRQKRIDLAQQIEFVGLGIMSRQRRIGLDCGSINTATPLQPIGCWK
jgi:hypothetical protein